METPEVAFTNLDRRTGTKWSKEAVTEPAPLIAAALDGIQQQKEAAQDREVRDAAATVLSALEMLGNLLERLNGVNAAYFDQVVGGPIQEKFDELEQFAR